MTRFAERKAAPPAQIALAWLLAQLPWTVSMPVTTPVTHLLDNIGTTSVTFTPAEFAELNRAVAAIEIRGARLPDRVLAFSGVEAPPAR